MIRTWVILLKGPSIIISVSPRTFRLLSTVRTLSQIVARLLLHWEEQSLGLSPRCCHSKLGEFRVTWRSSYLRHGLQVIMSGLSKDRSLFKRMSFCYCLHHEGCMLGIVCPGAVVWIEHNMIQICDTVPLARSTRYIWFQQLIGVVPSPVCRVRVPEMFRRQTLRGKMLCRSSV